MRILPFLLLPAICLAQDPGPSVEVQRDYNSLIVAQVKRIPEGGTYAANKLAIVRLRSAGHFESGKFFTIPKTPFPSFCSGATYLVFVRTLEELRRQGKLTYKFDTVNALVIRGQRDGEGIWGRWNANGPGTARLFHELKLGRNFTEYSQAKPGDFMKIFWTKEVGKLERGHSVIYMGSSKLDGADHVTFWSSNQPDGYGTKTIPKSKIAHAIFSRLENPENLNNITEIPDFDPYLGSLLEVRSSFKEAKEKCGIDH